MLLFRPQERPYLCEETILGGILLYYIILHLCLCISCVNGCTYVVAYQLPPFGILVVYAYTYVCILNEML